MFSKLWTNFWILVTSSDHDRDGPVGRLSFPSEYAADHRRLLGFTLLVLLLGHFWSLPGTYGSKLTGASSNKRRIAGTNGGKPLSEWDDIFQQRTDDDWRVLWHKEKHRRCQHQLLSHMELVCEKDIYKLARRKRKKRDISGGGGSDGAYFGALEDTTNSDPLEDADGTQTDTETDSRLGFLRAPNVTAPVPKHPLFVTFKEANLFGHRQLLKTRKRQLATGGAKNLGNPLMLSGTKRSSRIERDKRGISDECCSGTDGCSWEEYAEYCPANVRVRVAN